MKEQFVLAVNRFAEVWRILRENGSLLPDSIQGYVEGFTFSCSLFYRNAIFERDRLRYTEGIDAVLRYENRTDRLAEDFSADAARGFNDAKQFLEDAKDLSMDSSNEVL